jgi:hydroxypyruvate isomerase
VPDSVRYEVAYGTYLDNLAWAAQQAAHSDVTILVEVLDQRTAPGFVLRSQRQAVHAIQTVGDSRVRQTFDIYHCQRNEGDVTTLWRELLPWIGHIQVADTPDRHEPGTGELRWEFLFDEIAARGYNGWIGCEYQPSIDTPSSLGWRNRFASTLDDTKKQT